MLLLEGRTKRLALVNIAVAMGLVCSFAMISYFHSTESAFGGRLLGEAFGFAATLFLTRNLLKGVVKPLLAAYAIGFALSSASALLVFFGRDPTYAGGGLAALPIFASVILLWAKLVSVRFFEAILPRLTEFK